MRYINDGTGLSPLNTNGLPRAVLVELELEREPTFEEARKREADSIGFRLRDLGEKLRKALEYADFSPESRFVADCLSDEIDRLGRLLRVILTEGEAAVRAKPARLPNQPDRDPAEPAKTIEEDPAEPGWHYVYQD